MTNIFFAAMDLLIVGLKSLDFLYHFQVKEYRFDRFLAMTREKGFLRIFFTIERMPAKSWRNLLAASVMLILLTTWLAISYGNIYLLAGTLFLYAFAGFAVTAISVMLTSLPSAIRKYSVIRLATMKIAKHPVTVIGITGSFGKSTTKEYLYDILSQKYRTGRTLKNMNTDTGVALSILSELFPDTQYFIVEMGAYKRGEIRDICRMVKPKYAIITAIGNQHLRLFGSRENLISTKKELLDMLPPEGKAYVNASRAPVETLKAGVRANVLPYHMKEHSVNLSSYGLAPEIIRENLIPCILIARDLGLTEHEIRQGILAIKKRRQRLTPQKGKNDSIIIDNSYNTNRESCIYSIGVLESRHELHRILVTRGIIELGPEKLSTYRDIVHVLAKTKVLLFTTDADFGAGKSQNVRVFKNDEAMKDAILTQLGPKTVILIEGKMGQSFINFLKSK